MIRIRRIVLTDARFNCKDTLLLDVEVFNDTTFTSRCPGDAGDCRNGSASSAKASFVASGVHHDRKLLRLKFSGRNRPVEIAVGSISPYTVRIAVAPIENGSARAIPDDGSLVQAAWVSPRARIRTLLRSRIVRMGNLAIRLESEPLTFSIQDRNGRVVQKLQIDQTGALNFQIADGPVLGLGEGGPQFDRRGNKDQMRNGQGGYRLRTHGGRAAIPWLIGTRGWAMFIHQPFGTFDLTGSEGRFNPVSSATALPLNIFIVATRDAAQVMAEYASLTGRPEMPPLWSLGYLQSHRTLAGPEEIKWVARTFREKRLPCDALIYLGTDFAPSGWNTHNGEFTWHATTVTRVFFMALRVSLRSFQRDSY